MTPDKAIRHRNSIKRFFITFPQSHGITKEMFVEDLTENNPAERYICVQEPHQDGQPHLHLGIEYKSPLTKYQVLQILQHIYPTDYKRIDVKSMTSMKHTVTYLTFPDKDKIVDTSPLLFNIQLEDNYQKKHELFQQQFKDDDPLTWAPYCYCTHCATLLRLHRYKEILQEIDFYDLDNIT